MSRKPYFPEMETEIAEAQKVYDQFMSTSITSQQLQNNPVLRREHDKLYNNIAFARIALDDAIHCLD